MSNNSSIPWFNDFLGIAYRYYDLRMNLVPLFPDRKKATTQWSDTIHWWNDHTIKVRFVESGDQYWFVMGADPERPQTNKYFFKILQKSEHYERFKEGHGGEAYLRLGVFTKKYKKDVKNDAICNCGHEKEDHDEDDSYECLMED